MEMDFFCDDLQGFQGSSVVKTIKTAQLRWFGYMGRMTDNRRRYMNRCQKIQGREKAETNLALGIAQT